MSMDEAKRQIFSPGFAPGMDIEISGEDLTIDQVVAVARFGACVHLSDLAVVKVEHCRSMVDVLLDEKAVVYGLTTGFGKLRDRIIPVQHSARLQVNLIRSHACGVGAPFAEDIVRGAMVLRINTLAKGNSGIRLDTLNQLVNMLNDRIYPLVPVKGSVGASGDLAPLSHMMLPLIGDKSAMIMNPQKQKSMADVGRLYNDSPNRDDFIPLPVGDEFLEMKKRWSWNFSPVVLQAKEGLALNNGTQFMAAMAALSVYDGFFLLRVAELAAAVSLEAQRGVLFAYSDEIHQARNLSYQLECARRTRSYNDGSEILDVYLNSAFLNRAIRALEDVEEELQEEVRSESSVESVQVADCLVRIEQHIADIREFLTDARQRFETAKATFDTEVRRGMTKVRRQIKIFGEILRPIKQSITGTYALMNEPEFPLIEEARLKMASAIADLEKAVPASPPVQDDYSFRCFPQVIACAHRALWHMEAIVTEEINSATDNPLLFPPMPDGGWESMSREEYKNWLATDPGRINYCLEHVLGGGNFHGEPLALSADYFTMAIAEVGNIAERRIAHLVDETLSSGLHGFLIESTGLNSGFMVPQYTAAALVSENKVLCHPASIDSIPTCAGAEDHVSMGTISTRKGLEVLGNVRIVLAIELLAGYQALGFRKPLLPGVKIRDLIAYFEGQGIERFVDDRVMFPEIEAVTELLRNNALVTALEI